jgi:hypothetical protein
MQVKTKQEKCRFFPNRGVFSCSPRKGEKKEDETETMRTERIPSKEQEAFLPLI